LRGDRAFVGDEQTRSSRVFLVVKPAGGGCTSLGERGCASLGGQQQQSHNISQGGAQRDSLARARKNIAIALLYTLGVHVIAWTGNQIEGVLSAYDLLQVDVNSVLFQVSSVKTRLLI
jgi:hypothetical protein